MGGNPPLGYDVRDRKLTVNDKEAATVRYIFRLYRQLRSVRALRERLVAEGVTSKRRVLRDGRVTGGKPINRGGAVLPAAQPHLPGTDRPQGQGLSRRARGHYRSGALGCGAGDPDRQHPGRPPPRIPAAQPADGPAGGRAGRRPHTHPCGQEGPALPLLRLPPPDHRGQESRPQGMAHPGGGSGGSRRGPSPGMAHRPGRGERCGGTRISGCRRTGGVDHRCPEGSPNGGRA